MDGINRRFYGLTQMPKIQGFEEIALDLVLTAIILTGSGNDVSHMLSVHKLKLSAR